MKKLIKQGIEKLVEIALDWSTGYIVKYFDLDGDGKVTKKEMKTKLSPAAQKSIKLISAKL